MPRRFESMKDAISCDKVWGAASRLWSKRFRMGQPDGSYVPSSERKTYLVNWNILVARGKVINWDSPSSGERRGKSPNRTSSDDRGCGPASSENKLVEVSGKVQHRRWNSGRRKFVEWAGIQSTTGHEKPCGKPGGPPSKAKYYETTDSA